MDAGVRHNREVAFSADTKMERSESSFEYLSTRRDNSKMNTMGLNLQDYKDQRERLLPSQTFSPSSWNSTDKHRHELSFCEFCSKKTYLK